MEDNENLLFELCGGTELAEYVSKKYNKISLVVFFTCNIYYTYLSIVSIYTIFPPHITSHIQNLSLQCHSEQSEESEFYKMQE